MPRTQPSATARPMGGRARVRVRGVVQGVGFRPFVHALAEQHGLCGWVHNDDEGVLLEVQGQELPAFLDDLEHRPPPLARVDAVEVEQVPPRPEEGGFVITRSRRQAAVTTIVPPDGAVCDACLDELFDPSERRYRYPFLSCTHCGPRWTITRTLPYDRPNTSLAGFPLCEPCAAEYGDPRDRRFHAQPLACPRCGPRLSHSIEEVLEALRDGRIVALKGLGGFHLVCDATNEEAVARLRERKQRDGKPFAVMVASVVSARPLAVVSAQEAALLESNRRPIVLLEAREGTAIAPSVAPGLSTLGLMLPATPLHYLLFHEAAGRPEGRAWLASEQALALVLTSANPGGEPLVVDDAEAEERLGGIADRIVGHDRAIEARTDDSVTRVVGGAPMMIRRARGWVPEALKLSRRLPSVLALGGHLKVTACLTRRDEAFMSQHVGDLDDRATLRFLDEVVARLRDVLEVEPVAIARDGHPDFASTRCASAFGLPVVAVQHHHAHVAAVLAEHRVDEPTLGIALDGYGMGLGGEAWGGELLWVDGDRFDRVGHLAPLALPGGDRAAREPWRMAVAALVAVGREDLVAERFGAEGELVAQMIARGINSPMTTSAGRWFDAVAGLCGLRRRSGFEAEAAMALEGLVARVQPERGGYVLREGVLDLRPLVPRLLDAAPKEAAERWHGTLAEGLVRWALEELEDRGAHRLVLSGGCFANRVLTEAVVARLEQEGVEALVPRQVPSGDGGLSLGQAWVAARRMERRSIREGERS